MLHYVLQVVTFQIVFLLVYDVFLKRETFFNTNRFYLLATAVASFIIPFIKLGVITTIVPQDFVVRLPEVVIGKVDSIIKTTNIDSEVNTLATDTLWLNWQLLFWLGCLLALAVFVIKLGQLLWLLYNNPKRWKGNLLIVSLKQSNAAFSFFNRIFIGDQIDENQAPMVISHETIHAKQWHTLDLLLFEAFRIVMWFNPLIYVYQDRIKALHEFIADANAIKKSHKKVYYQGLLYQIFGTSQASFTNSFYRKSLLKKRIIMLQQSKSKPKNLLKYIVLFPVIIGMLVYVSCEKEIVSKTDNSIDLEQFSYTAVIGKEFSEEDKKHRDKIQTFLKSNPDYVTWIETDMSTNTTRFSIHHKDEIVPKDFKKLEFKRDDGTLIVSYISFGKTKVKAETNTIDPEMFNGKSEVPYAVIDQVPVFEGCDDLSTNEERKRCTSEQISKFVNLNFDTNLASQLNLVGRQRISVFFKINTSGEIIEANARAPHPDLEEEAKRVINLLPKFKPGVHNGATVTVPYSLPILFQVQD